MFQLLEAYSLRNHAIATKNILSFDQLIERLSMLGNFRGLFSDATLTKV